MPKNIAIFFRLPGVMDHPFDKPEYIESYSELAAEIEKLGGVPYFVRTQSSYLGNGKFSNSWQMRDRQLIETGPITANAIFNKGRFQTDNTVPVFNNPEITKICTDKWYMYEQLKEFCPPTWYVENLADLTAALPKLTTQKAVFKPLTGSEGVGVKIEDKTFFEDSTLQLHFPGVVSEFLDTSVGVPGIVDGHHDLRTAIFDGEILYSYYRTPPTGSLLANVSQGGRFEMLDPSRLPADVVSISKLIDAQLAHIKHRFYSVDYGYTKDGPRIIEMNSELGLLPNSDHPAFRILKHKIASVLLELSS